MPRSTSERDALRLAALPAAKRAAFERHLARMRDPDIAPHLDQMAGKDPRKRLAVYVTALKEARRLDAEDARAAQTRAAEESVVAQSELETYERARALGPARLAQLDAIYEAQGMPGFAQGLASLESRIAQREVGRQWEAFARDGDKVAALVAERGREGAAAYFAQNGAGHLIPVAHQAYVARRAAEVAKEHEAIAAEDQLGVLSGDNALAAMMRDPVKQAQCSKFLVENGLSWEGYESPVHAVLTGALEHASVGVDPEHDSRRHLFDRKLSSDEVAEALSRKVKGLGTADEVKQLFEDLRFARGQLNLVSRFKKSAAEERERRAPPKPSPERQKQMENERRLRESLETGAKRLGLDRTEESHTAHDMDEFYVRAAGAIVEGKTPEQLAGTLKAAPRVREKLERFAAEKPPTERDHLARAAAKLERREAAEVAARGRERVEVSTSDKPRTEREALQQASALLERESTGGGGSDHNAGPGEATDV